MKEIQSIGEGLLPHARSVADQVFTQWVMDVRREDMERSMRGEDAAQPVNGAEPRSEVNVAPVSFEPNVVPPRIEQPAPASIAPSADAAGLAQ